MAKPSSEEMKILLIASFQQGVGKTTLLYLIACYLASLGKHVRVGDYDLKNPADTIYDYCKLEANRGFDVMRFDEMTESDFKDIDYLLIDMPYEPDPKLLEKLSNNAHAALIPLTIEHKSYNVGAHRAIKSINGCDKRFVVQHTVDPGKVKGRYEDIDCYSRAHEIPVLHEMPALPAASHVVTGGLAPQHVHNVPGIDQLRSEMNVLGSKVAQWLATV